MELGGNMNLTILQIIIIILAIVIIILIFTEGDKTSALGVKLDNFKCPECPACPPIPPCECDAEGCPACICKDKKCPKCPEIPECPKAPKSISVKDILNGIFPGRNPGFSAHGKYYPLANLGKKQSVEAAYSTSKNLVPNYLSGDGNPAAISFADQRKISEKKQKFPPLASKKEPAPPPISDQSEILPDKKTKTKSP